MRFFSSLSSRIEVSLAFVNSVQYSTESNFVDQVKNVNSSIHKTFSVFVKPIGIFVSWLVDFLQKW